MEGSKNEEKDQKTKQEWADMSDGEADGDKDGADQENEEKTHTIIQKPKPPAPKKGTKNERGDYVVTSIDIPDMRTGVSKA